MTRVDTVHRTWSPVIIRLQVFKQIHICKSENIVRTRENLKFALSCEIKDVTYPCSILWPFYTLHIYLIGKYDFFILFGIPFILYFLSRY